MTVSDASATGSRGHTLEQALQLLAAPADSRTAAQAVALIVSERRTTVLALLGALDADGRRRLLVRARSRLGGGRALVRKQRIHHRAGAIGTIGTIVLS
jgi:hypothetical protein